MARRLRELLGALMRTIADRIDDQHAVVRTGLSFTFEGVPGGIRLRSDGLGCPLYRMGAADLRRAHEESESLHAVDDNWDLASAVTVAIDTTAGTAQTVPIRMAAPPVTTPVQQTSG